MSGINTYNFAVSHEEAAKMIAANGAKVSYVLEGQPGIGKSAVLGTLQELLGDKYEYIYFDTPNKDLPDIGLPALNHENRVTETYTHALWYGKDKHKPKIVMMDEVGKGGGYVQLLSNRILLERTVGDYRLPEGSIVFGTTNFATDGVGDSLNGHTGSRIARVAMRLPLMEEWVHWAHNHGISPLLLSWVSDNPMVFASYKDTAFNKQEHDDGQGVFHYVYHPQHNNNAYVCPRSLALASHQINNMDVMGEALLTKALIGTVGGKAALDMAATFSLGNELPRLEDIERNPEHARIPESVAASMMMVFKSVQFIDKKNVGAYTTYFSRFRKEMLATWAKTCVANNKARTHVLNEKAFQKVCLDNAWVLS